MSVTSTKKCRIRDALISFTASLGMVAISVSCLAESWCDGQELAPSEFARIDVDDPWFVVDRIENAVFAIREPRQAEGVNSYLIVGMSRAVLFDTGLGIGRISRVVQQLTQLPVTVVNSHTHFDHVGGNAEFEDVRSLDMPFSVASALGESSTELSDYASSTLNPDHVCGALPSGALPGPYRTRPWRIASYLHDRETLDLGGRVLEVMLSPGHTPDSLALLDRRNGLLFTGDSYYSGDIYLWAKETNLDDYSRSIGRLALLVPDLKRLLPAHGVPTAIPERLKELNNAVVVVRAGQAAFTRTSDHRRLYRFGAFSLLLSDP